MSGGTETGRVSVIGIGGSKAENTLTGIVKDSLERNWNNFRLGRIHSKEDFWHEIKNTDSKVEEPNERFILELQKNPSLYQFYRRYYNYHIFREPVRPIRPQSFPMILSEYAGQISRPIYLLGLGLKRLFF